MAWRGSFRAAAAVGRGQVSSLGDVHEVWDKLASLLLTPEQAAFRKQRLSTSCRMEQGFIFHADAISEASKVSYGAKSAISASIQANVRLAVALQQVAWLLLGLSQF